MDVQHLMDVQHVKPTGCTPAVQHASLHVCQHWQTDPGCHWELQTPKMRVCMTSGLVAQAEATMCKVLDAAHQAKFPWLHAFWLCMHW